MDITKYIYDYLMEYNTPVVVPELGCFTIVNKPSEIRDGIVVPPAKTVELDSENGRDDNVLTLYIAKKENITMEQAAEEVRSFYKQFFTNRLPFDKKVAFDNFGIFTLSEFGDIVFTPEANFFKDNYGLGNAYIPGDAAQQHQPGFTAATPDIPIPPVEPFTMPEPAQTITEPVQPAQEPTQAMPEPEPVPEPEVKPEPEGSLFDTNDGARFRENTERRRPAADKVEEPVKPNRPAKTPPPPPKKRQGQAKTSSSSNLWVLWLLLAAAALGVAGYFIYPMFTSHNTTLSTIVDANNEAKPLHDDETEGETPNTGVAQTLNDATDKKNALNPAGSQQTAASPTSQSKPATPSPAPKTESKPATVAQSQGNSGHGKYVLVIGSFTTHSAAETYGKKLRDAGIGYEIVDAGDQRYRISVASFDDKAEAIRQADQMKSKPYCENIWVARR